MERDYKLEKWRYYEVLWFIRGYPTYLKERMNLLGLKGVSYGGIRSPSVGDPTGNQAVQLSKVEDKIKAIESALNRVPEEYRKGLLDNIIKGRRYPDYAHTVTWKRWRRRFIYWVSEKMQ